MQATFSFCLSTLLLLITLRLAQSTNNGRQSLDKNDIRFGPECTNRCCESGQSFSCVRFRPGVLDRTYATCMTYGACYASNGKRDQGDWHDCLTQSRCDPGAADDRDEEHHHGVGAGQHRDAGNRHHRRDDDHLHGRDQGTDDTASDAALCALVKKLRTSVPNMRRELMSFWSEHGPDSKYGGFHATLNRQGNPVLLPNSSTDKGLVQQARYLWTVSTYHGMFGKEVDPHYAQQLKDIADNLYKFLMDYFLDVNTDLFLWKVKRSGESAGKDINLYGNFFAIYGLAKYAEVFRNQAAAQQALKTFTALDQTRFDPINGGYDQSADAPAFDKDKNDKPVPKGFNANLHGMEALAQLYKTTRNQKVKEQLIALVQLLVDKALIPWSPMNRGTPTYYGLMYFDKQWKPVLGYEQKEHMVSHGHFLEFFWLLLETLDILGPEYPADRRAQTILKAQLAAEYSAKFGSDGSKGYCDHSAVSLGCSADERWWWVQDEAVLGLWQLYQRTAKPEYLKRLEQTYNWIINDQTDPDFGEQYAIINATAPQDSDVNTRLIEFEGLKGGKGSFWKASYHSVRTFMNLEQWIKKTTC